jgi:hypothetical protein
MSLQHLGAVVNLLSGRLKSRVKCEQSELLLAVFHSHTKIICEHVKRYWILLAMSCGIHLSHSLHWHNLFQSWHKLHIYHRE